MQSKHPKRRQGTALQKSKVATFGILAVCCTFLIGCNSSQPKSLVVFAAASTQEPLKKIAARFEAETGMPVELSFEASSTLAMQIEKGAHADLFLSADEDWADYLDKHDLSESKRDLLTNQLIVIVPADSALEIETLADLASPAIHHLALAADQVPAGRYARESLKHERVWDKVRERVISAGNVTATVGYVARAEAEAGIVYATDPAGNSKVRACLTIPADFHQPIRYPLVKIKQDSPGPGRDRFFEYLLSDKAKEIFRQAGFGVVP